MKHMRIKVFKGDDVQQQVNSFIQACEKYSDTYSCGFRVEKVDLVGKGKNILLVFSLACLVNCQNNCSIRTNNMPW